MVVVVAMTLGAGCGAARPRTGSEAGHTSYLFSFPTREEIAALASEASAPALTPPPTVSRFEMTAPATATTHDVGGVWETLVTEVAEAGGVHSVGSARARCAADQLARFGLAHRDAAAGIPPELVRHALARCGALVVQHAIWAYQVETDEATTDAEIIARFGDGIRADLAGLFPAGGLPGTFDVGVWVAREGRMRVIAAVLARADGAFVEPPSVTDGVAHVALELHRPVELGLALINQGRFGFAPCDAVLEATVLHLACPMAEGDGAAWVAIFGGRATSPLLEPLGEMMVARGPSDGWVYELVAPAGADAGGDGAADVAAAINAFRAEAGLGALSLAPAQSEVAATLAPRFFDPAVPPGEREVMSMGLLAGWDVGGGLIGDANLVADGSMGSNAALWAAGSIARPLGRLVLLNPDADALAVGVMTARGAISALAVTYRHVVGRDPAQTMAVYEALDAARAARGLPPVQRSAVPSRLEAMADAIARGTDPAAALESERSALSAELPGDADLRILSVADPAFVALGLPEALLASPRLRVAVTTAPWAPEGMPWAQTEVLLLFYP